MLSFLRNLFETKATKCGHQENKVIALEE